jgi:hypothetical protein
MGMKRVLLVSVILTVLAGCGGSPAPVGQNSADSITTTAVGNVVASVPSPTPTPTENAAAAVTDNVAVPDDSAATNETSTDTSASSDAHQE